MDLPPIPLPLLSVPLVFSISSTLILQMANTRNHNNNNNNGDNNGENNQNVNPLPPLLLLLNKCWLCKHKWFILCCRLWSTYGLLNLNHRHRHRGIVLETLSSLSRQPFLKLWRQWMLAISSSQLRRSCKWCSATTVSRCC
jgi:hypothetical protein